MTHTLLSIIIIIILSLIKLIINIRKKMYVETIWELVESILGNDGSLSSKKVMKEISKMAEYDENIAKVYKKGKTKGIIDLLVHNYKYIKDVPKGAYKLIKGILL